MVQHVAHKPSGETVLILTDNVGGCPRCFRASEVRKLYLGGPGCGAVVAARGYGYRVEEDIYEIRDLLRSLGFDVPYGQGGKYPDEWNLSRETTTP